MTANRFEIRVDEDQSDDWEQSFLDLLLQLNPVVTNISDENTQSNGDGSQSGTDIPDILPILPLRGVVVYPLTGVPLTVGQARSVSLVDDIVKNERGKRIIGLVTSRDPDLEIPGVDDLYHVGTAAAVHQLIRSPDGSLRLLVQGLARFQLGDLVTSEPYLKSHVDLIPETEQSGLEIEALTRTAVDQFQRLSDLIPSIPSELLSAVLNMDNPRQLVYALAAFLRIELKKAQELLELDRISDKLQHLIAVLSKELEVLELGRKIQEDAQSEIGEMQRDYYLREQLKAIQRELGDADEHTVEIEEFRQKIESASMPAEALKEANRELGRLAKLPAAAAEYGVIRTYVDWMTSLPWNVTSNDNLDVAHARAILEEDHFGLADIKERILEFLAVRKLRLERRGKRSHKETTDHIRPEREGVILCLVGPPGVGKTSLGQSISRAMGRKFVRISLGGVRDEAEIRGHRRTYIGAMPGQILQSLRRCETRNPVFMIDEIDKLGNDYRGDPASALLELLDPEQNRGFRDHYLDVPFDLSQVFFITTANMLESIPGPLRDRMEILQLAGYTEREKLEIAKGYLVPRQIREHGLRKSEITFRDDAVQKIIRYYTREAGVRNLERELGTVCRKVVTGITEGQFKSITINTKRVVEHLGKPRHYFAEEISERTALPGVATGLAWTPLGGDVLFIEATKMPGEHGFQLTGQLGDVMQESAKAAFSYVRSKSDLLGLPDGFFENSDVHVHVPAGSQPKDGPSAGVTVATALASLFSNKPVRPDVGMTGEITLRGHVMPVGGIKEKVLAAHRAGLNTVILPQRNKNDLDDVPQEIRDQVKFVFANQIEEVIVAALVPGE